MHTLRLVHNAPPKTYGEGFVDGREDGYEQGRRDRGLELLALGFFCGLIALAALLLLVLH